MSIEAKAEVVFQSRDALGEGPMWLASEQRLYWVDLLAKRLLRGDPASGRIETRELPYAASRVTACGDGRLLFSFLRRPALGCFEGDAFELIELGNAVADKQRFNDGVCDARGRFWTATYDQTLKQANGRLLRFAGRRVEHMVKDVDKDMPNSVDNSIMLPNGIRISPDEREMLFIDSWPGKVWAYDFDAEAGLIGSRRLFIDFEGSGAKPDGCAIDTEGCLWIAEVNRARVARYTPDGRLDRSISVPTDKPTSVSFGGSDLRTLYITTRIDGLSDAQRAAQPEAGAVFAARVGTAGLPEHAFRPE